MKLKDLLKIIKKFFMKIKEKMLQMKNILKRNTKII